MNIINKKHGLLNFQSPDESLLCFDLQIDALHIYFYSITLVHVVTMPNKKNIIAHSFLLETASDYITTWDKIEGRKQASGNKLTTSGRIIIISIGSVVCFILILVIIRELWLCCQFPQPTGKRTVINDVYEDIAEIYSVRVE